jgi:predicted Zn-dependent peptidase
VKEVVSAALGERIFWGVLECGMSVYVMPRGNWRQRSALLAFDFGALDRVLCFRDGRQPLELPAGSAHFLEHRLFEKASGDITERFSLSGAEVDADTSFTHTGFSFSCRESHVEALELLLELAFVPPSSAAGVQREREIIEHEIQSSADVVEWVGYFRALATVFPAQALADDIAGTRSTMAAIDVELLRTCHAELYRGANASLFVCGDVDPASIVAGVESWLDQRPHLTRAPTGHAQRRPLPELPARWVQSTLPIARPHLSLVFRDMRPRLVGLPLLRREMALELALYVLFGPGSRFYGEHYESGLLDSSSFGFEVNAEPDFGMCTVSGETPDPEVLSRACIGELERAREQGLDTGDFNIAKRKAYGDIVRSYDQVDSCVALMHSAVSCGAQPFDFLLAHQQVTQADAEACMRDCLDPSRCGRSLILPAEAAAGIDP